MICAKEINNMKSLMEYFYDIAAIPHISGHEQALADYIEDIAHQNNLQCLRDSVHNLIVIKPASSGYETSTPVLLQGHLDMVGVQKKGYTHDFLHEPIHLVQEGDILSAKGTTLGADDGVAIALMLALLADDTLRHPRLECVFTVQEETGLFGAQALDATPLKAARMINLDAGPEGIFLVSCAGGCRMRLTKALHWEQTSLSAWQMQISGLRGGHSGADIAAERANALVLAGTLLDALCGCGIQIVRIEGGDKDNVIPSEVNVCFVAEQDPTALFAQEIAAIRANWAVADPDIAITLSPAAAEQALCLQDSQAVTGLLLLLPHGVVSLSAAMPGLVETSANLAAIHMQEELCIQVSLRSSSEVRKAQLKRKVEQLAALFGACVEVGGEYPGWAYEAHSPLRQQAEEVYQTLFGVAPKIEGMHAGLECGVFKGKMPDLDILAIGPEHGEIHTPEEWLDIRSFHRYHKFLIQLLEKMHI